MPSPVRRRRPAVALFATATSLAAVTCGTTGTVRTDAAPAVQNINANLPEQEVPNRGRVLFIRGAPGTAGTDPNKGPDDNELADIGNVSNAPNSHGYGKFAIDLADAGYDVAQVNETGSVDSKRTVDLNALKLSQYKVVVFASNNAVYDNADATAVRDYVQAGGSVLFLSDLNFGTNNSAAPQSDNNIMTPAFNVVMNQDNGQTEPHTAADFLDKSHPIFTGVDKIDNFGVSACTKLPSADAKTRVLIPFETNVQLNDNPSGGGGSTRQAGANDGALVVFEPGSGRGACLYDRDLFFNSQLEMFSHRRFAMNLINWLAKQ